MLNFDQAEFDIRCEWGIQGVMRLAPISDVIVIIDVLSFSTCVEIANSQGAIIFPYQWKDESAQAFAESLQARLAQKRGNLGYSLSPASLLSLNQGDRLVLPSPNGSSLSLATKGTPTLCGCLRNCRSVALAAVNYGRRIAIIPAGEKWQDWSLRPSFEDLIGAGAIISYLHGTLSPEAQGAMFAYHGAYQSLRHLIKQCNSGKELIERGFEDDVDLAAALDVSHCVPILTEGAYINHLSVPRMGQKLS